MIKKIFYTVVFCWMAIVIFSYFLKFPLPNFTQHTAELFLLSILFFVSFCIGNFVLDKLGADLLYRNLEVFFKCPRAQSRMRDENPRTPFNLSFCLRIPFAVGLGFALFSIITFFLGIFGLLYKSVFYILFLVLFFVSVKNLKVSSLSRGFQKPFKDFLAIQTKSGVALWYVFLIIIFFIFFAVALVGALTPPTFYDSLVYHLAVPLQYIKHHQIIKIDNNLFSNFPQNIEMLYTMALVLYNDILTNLIHFTFLPLISVLIYGFVREMYSNKTSIVASLIFSTTPAVVILASGTYLDLGLTFYLLLSFVALMKWTQTQQNRWLVLSGLLCGFSFGIKYIAGISVVIFTLIILYDCFTKKQNIFQKIVLFLIPAFLVFLPWLVKNYMFTGNPLFPFYIFGCAPDYVQKYLLHVSCHGTGGVSNFVRLPWDITMDGVKFGGGFDIVGPLYLIFLPILALITKTDKITKLCFSYLMLYFLCWSFSAKVLRFLIPIFPVAAVVFSVCISEFISEQTLTRNIVKIIFGAIITSNFVILVFIQNFVMPLPQLFGNITRDAHLTSGVLSPNNFYPAVKFMNDNLDGRSKTLFVGEARNYYTAFNTVASSPFDKDIFTDMANGSETAEVLLGKLQSAGFTNIFWSYREYERLKNGFRPNDFIEQSSEIVNVFKKKYLNLLYEKDGLCVYKIREKGRKVER